MVQGYPPHFGYTELRSVERAPSQQVLLYASTASGAGVSEPYMTNVGDTNPLLPLMAADAPLAEGWTSFDIPSNLPNETNLLVASVKLIITNPSNKIASVYFSARRDRSWDGWSPEIQGMDKFGDREAQLMFIPVKERAYDCRWWISSPENATPADGMTCAINISLSAYGVWPKRKIEAFTQIKAGIEMIIEDMS